jgi:hypothetical protein
MVASSNGDELGWARVSVTCRYGEGERKRVS